MFVRCSHPNVSTFSGSVSAMGAIFSATVRRAGAMFVRKRCDVCESLQIPLPLDGPKQLEGITAATVPVVQQRVFIRVEDAVSAPFVGALCKGRAPEIPQHG